ncbi:MAG: acetolactate decarboxylase [Mycobacterium sp.]|nr:acetolactate decarboxylase [Mycobacterium sp.]
MQLSAADWTGVLLDGGYDSDLTLRELLQHGNFGLGTVNRLEGGTLVLDAVCSALPSDGADYDVAHYAAAFGLGDARAIKVVANYGALAVEDFKPRFSLDRAGLNPAGAEAVRHPDPLEVRVLAEPEILDL